MEQYEHMDLKTPDESRLWLVLALYRTIEVSVDGVEVPVPIIDAQRTVGIMPVFASLEEANAFSAGKYSVLCIERDAQ